MCRVLSYLGKPIIIDDLLYGPDNSLVEQTYNPKLMDYILNLAGFGMAAWHSNLDNETDTPFIYKTAQLPFFDVNLKRLALRLKAQCLVSHIRGVGFSEDEVVIRQNAHPFIYPGFHLALAHNGSLAQIDEMKHDLLEAMKPDIRLRIRGTTDSEWVYALLLSQFDQPEAQHTLDETTWAMHKMLGILRDIRHKHKLGISSPLNLFVTNGDYLVSLRFVFDYGVYSDAMSKAHMQYHSMWYTYGGEYKSHDGDYKMSASTGRESVLFASEPLTDDKTSWLEVPEYSLALAWKEKEEILIKTLNVDV